MKKIKKIILIIILLVLIIAGIIYYIAQGKQENNVQEYEPQEEISNEQERQTMISLYFTNKNTKMVEPEARLIDVKEIVKEPYTTLVNLLIEGPKNENHEKNIPEGTKLLSAKLNGECLILDFSEEFINNHTGGKEEEERTIESIVNTVTELTEVNSLKILINGKENQSFKDSEINFKQEFKRSE